MNKRKNIIITVLFFMFIFIFSALLILKPQEAFSESERRELKGFPELSTESVLSGEFSKEFEEYSQDRFPLRDTFRQIKAWFSTKIFNKLDNNGLFVADGHISKIDSKKNHEMMDYAADKFAYIFDTYLKDKDVKVYFSIVPDKNFVLAPSNGYPSLNYDSFIEEMKEKTSYMQYIEVRDLLELDDYYTTDTHWRQEKIIDVADRLVSGMGNSLTEDVYKENTLEVPFNGVYKGQLAMNFKPDEIIYLTNETIDNAKITYYDTGIPKEGDMYNMKKASGKDPYEMFLSGTSPLITIENPFIDNDRELVLFRDSFGSSMAPIMTSAYKKITLVDIRYIQSAFIGNFVKFHNQDVLFLYSTTLLNNSLALK